MSMITLIGARCSVHVIPTHPMEFICNTFGAEGCPKEHNKFKISPSCFSKGVKLLP